MLVIKLKEIAIVLITSSSVVYASVVMKKDQAAQ